MTETVPTADLLAAAQQRFLGEEAKNGMHPARQISVPHCRVSKFQVILRGADGVHLATYIWQRDEDTENLVLQRLDIEMTTLGILAAAELLLEDHGTTTAIEVADTVIVATKLMEQARLVRDKISKGRS
jgi:hypothetical protein